MSQFIYLLNAMEDAAEAADPFAKGYGPKRTAVLEYVENLEASRGEAEQPSIETIRLAGAVLDAKDEGWDEALEAAALEAENWEYGETAARKIREMKRLSRSEEK